jgi:hypothetical protein
VDFFDEASHDMEHIAQEINLIDLCESKLCHQWNEIVEDQSGSFLFNTNALGYLRVLLFYPAQVDLH